MKKVFVLACAVVLGLVFTGTVFAAAKATFKKGDEVYVCPCPGCPCQTISKKPGKCGCDKDLVKTTVDKVAKGKIYVTVDGKPFVFKTKGKYVCACPCGCDTISQKPGQCGCGKPLKAAKGS
jgi:hypothetical protein